MIRFLTAARHAKRQTPNAKRKHSFQMEFEYNGRPTDVWTHHLSPRHDKLDFYLGCRRMAETHDTFEKFVHAARFVRYAFEWFWHASGQSSEIMSLLASAFAGTSYTHCLIDEILDTLDFIYGVEPEFEEDAELVDRCRTLAAQFRVLHPQHVL